MAIPASLYASPGFLGFMRESGLAEQMDEVDATDRVDLIRRQLAMRLPEIAEQGEHQRDSISGGFEDRGLLRSGMHETALARQRAAQGRESAGTIAEGERQVSDTRSALMRRLLDLRRRRAETGLDTASDLHKAGF